jgi:enolase-phosphatase E1
MNVRAFLLDIEGTTTPISFVHDVLFSYARRELTTFLSKHLNSPEVVDDLARVRQEHAVDLAEGRQPPAITEGKVADYIYWLIDQDRKSAALKSLQGKIWQQGYDDGSLKAPVFEDVPRALQRWHDAGTNISIFSSGSVLAQKLLFAHTDAGDLTKFISSYFDTKVGKKMEAESYRRIAGELAIPANEIHFVSDVVAELDAASDGGMRTSLCVRPGNDLTQVNSQHNAVTSFDEL